LEGITDTPKEASRRKIPKVALKVSLVIDLVSGLLGLAYPLVASVLSTVWKEDPKKLFIINSISIGMNFLIALGPIKSRILNSMKKTFPGN
jgi:hypothetical protein